MSCRSSLVLAATLAALVGVGLSEAASARDYKIGCANGACVIVDDTGRISFFTIGDKKLAEGDDQLKPSALGRIRPPLNFLATLVQAATPVSSQMLTATSGLDRRALAPLLARRSWESLRPARVETANGVAAHTPRRSDGVLRGTNALGDV